MLSQGQHQPGKGTSTSVFDRKAIFIADSSTWYSRSSDRFMRTAIGSGYESIDGKMYHADSTWSERK